MPARSFPAGAASTDGSFQQACVRVALAEYLAMLKSAGACAMTRMATARGECIFMRSPQRREPVICPQGAARRRAMHSSIPGRTTGGECSGRVRPGATDAKLSGPLSPAVADIVLDEANRPRLVDLGAVSTTPFLEGMDVARLADCLDRLVA